jgi:hypothetical protein
LIFSRLAEEEGHWCPNTVALMTPKQAEAILAKGKDRRGSGRISFSSFAEAAEWRRKELEKQKQLKPSPNA